MQNSLSIALAAVICAAGCGAATETSEDGDATAGEPTTISSAGAAPSAANTGTNANLASGGAGVLPSAPGTSSGGTMVAAPNDGSSPLPPGVPAARDPNLPGADFEDGGWIQLGSSFGGSSGGTTGSVQWETGGYGGGDVGLGAGGSRDASSGGSVSIR